MSKQKLNPLRGLRLMGIHAMPHYHSYWHASDVAKELIEAAHGLTRRYGLRVDTCVVHKDLFDDVRPAGHSGWRFPIRDIGQTEWSATELPEPTRPEVLDAIVLGGFLVVAPDLEDDPLGVLRHYPLFGKRP